MSRKAPFLPQSFKRYIYRFLLLLMRETETAHTNGRLLHMPQRRTELIVYSVGLRNVILFWNNVARRDVDDGQASEEACLSLAQRSAARQRPAAGRHQRHDNQSSVTLTSMSSWWRYRHLPFFLYLNMIDSLIHNESNKGWLMHRR